MVEESNIFERQRMLQLIYEGLRTLAFTGKLD